jgi:hypothetical protein
MTGTDNDTDSVGDSELFNQAMADDPAEEMPAELAAPEGSQPRDDQGRFASPAPKETPPATTQPPADDRLVDHRIPLAEHLTARERAYKAEQERDQYRQHLDAMQRQLAEMRYASQPKPEPAAKPDPLLDPDAYEAYIERKFEDRLLGERREQSMRMAQRSYRDEFPEAYRAAQVAMSQGDHALQARMHASGDPGETLIEWHREQRTVREVGNDPNAWLERKLEERLNDPAFLAKAIERARGAAGGNGKAAAPRVNLPPSLSRTANVSAVSSDAFEMSDAALFRDALP